MKDEYDIEAEVYDEIWGKHDYETDVKLLDELFKKHLCKRIIDVGCGTGNHAIRLGRLGYEVTGIDISPVMLEKARKKSESSQIRFIQGDMKKIEKAISEGKKFDAAICLGSVSFHLTTNNDIRSFLRGLRNTLRKNGLFVTNVRNAEKISEDYLNKLIVEHMVTEGKQQLLVLAYNTRDPRNPDIIIWRPIFLGNINGKIDFRIMEHKLRWGRFTTWKRLLSENGFKLIATYSTPTKEEFNEKNHGNMLLVATAKRDRKRIHSTHKPTEKLYRSKS